MFVSVSYLINMNSFLPTYPLRPHPLYSSMALIHSHSLQCNLTENAETMRKKIKSERSSDATSFKCRFLNYLKEDVFTKQK